MATWFCLAHLKIHESLKNKEYKYSHRVLNRRPLSGKIMKKKQFLEELRLRTPILSLEFWKVVTPIRVVRVSMRQSCILDPKMSGCSMMHTCTYHQECSPQQHSLLLHGCVSGVWKSIITLHTSSYLVNQQDWRKKLFFKSDWTMRDGYL